MNANDDVFIVIKSLTPSEKRYFKIFTSNQRINDSKLYMLLFDTLDKLELYDEEKIKKKLKKPAIIKSLPQMKIYLLQLIMKSLRLFHSETHILNSVFELLTDAQIYKWKGLHELEEKTLLKAKEIVEKYQVTYFLIPILHKLKQNQMLFGNRNPFDVIDVIHNEENKAMQLLTDEVSLNQISTRLESQYNINPLLNDQEKIASYNKLKENPLLKNYEQHKTFKSKFFYLKSHCFICRFNDDNKNSLPYYRKIIQIIQEDKNIQKFNPTEYSVALNNYLAACHRAQEYGDFLEVLIKLESMTPALLNEQIQHFNLNITYHVLYMLNTGDLNNSDEIVQKAEIGIQKYKKKMLQRSLITLYYNLSILEFMKSNFKKSLYFNSQILDQKFDKRQELQAGAKLLHLFLHYELGNKVYLESLLRSTERNLKKTNAYFGFEKILINHFRKLINCIPSAEKKIFKTFKEEVLLLKLSSANFKFVIIDETIIWANSHINNTSLQLELFNLAKQVRNQIQL